MKEGFNPLLKYVLFGRPTGTGVYHIHECEPPTPAHVAFNNRAGHIIEAADGHSYYLLDGPYPNSTQENHEVEGEEGAVQALNFRVQRISGDSDL